VIGEDEAGEERGESDSDEEEQIIVMREEERIDPEAEAEFDKERMMAESLDSRKFERKAHFDVPLPIRKVQRMPVGEPVDEEVDSGAEALPHTMAFSLMTKKGNRPQVTSRFLFTPTPACRSVDRYLTRVSRPEQSSCHRTRALPYR
jgi:regulator of nonsense transcripts 2